MNRGLLILGISALAAVLAAGSAPRADQANDRVYREMIEQTFEDTVGEYKEIAAFVFDVTDQIRHETVRFALAKAEAAQLTVARTLVSLISPLDPARAS